MSNPAARHAEAAGQDTLIRLTFVPRGGVARTVQLVPFHEVAAEPPTAMHDVVVAHETDRSVGIGLVVSVQVVPFQDSITGSPSFVTATALHDVADAHDSEMTSEVALETSVHVVPFHATARLPSASFPAARQKVVDGHDTAYSDANVPPGVDWSVQLVPFHDSVTGLSFAPPTAMQKVVVVHDTASAKPKK
jgi:hypothetical protein